MSKKFKHITQDLQLSHLESMPLRHIVDELADMNADQISMAFGEPEKPACAVVILRGENTRAYLDALDECHKEIES